MVTIMNNEWWNTQPDDINVHHFIQIANLRGSCYRKWCAFLHYKGIMIGFINHDWVVLASSDPKAEWVPGCQDSCAINVDCMPKPTDGKARLVSMDDLPKQARPLAEQWVREAIDIARQKIDAWQRQEEDRQRQEELKREQKHKREVVDPWLRAVEEMGVH